VSAEGGARIHEAIRRRQQPLGAVITIGGWLGEPATEALMTVLGVEEVSREVTSAIMRVGRGAVPALIESVATGERASRIAAAPLLGALGDRRATAVLAGLISSHDTELAIAAVSALAALGDPAALDAIVELFAHPDVTVRQSALAAVHSLGDHRVRTYTQAALTSDDSHIREAAVRIAGYFGFEETAAAVVRALRDPSEDVRRAAIEQVPLLDDPGGVDLLLQALRSESPRNRAAAAHALRSVDGHVEPALVDALADPDAWVRYFAAGSLGAQGARSAAEPLARLATVDGPPHVRIAALEALAAVAPSRLRDIVYVIIGDPEEHVAAAAVKALAHVDDPEADARLEETIGGPHDDLRLAAAAALTIRASARAVEALEWAAQLAEPAALSSTALDGLRSIAAAGADGPARAAVTALVALGTARPRRNAVIDALGTLPPERIAWIAELYRTSDPEARVLLVGVCARLHHRDATALVVEALSDEAVQVRVAAVAAAGRIGAALAQPRVVSLTASDPSPAVRHVASAVCRRRGWDGQGNGGRQ
jgi:HEAT repeat protein